MGHLTLLSFALALAAGLAGVVLLLQLHQRHGRSWLRTGAWQLVLFNLVLAVTAPFLYFQLNLAGRGLSAAAELGVEIAYLAVSTLLKVGWVILLWLMALEMLGRRPGRWLRSAGILYGIAAGLSVGVGTVVGLSRGSVDDLAVRSFALEILVVLGAWAATIYLFVGSRSIASATERGMVRRFALAISAFWTLITAIVVGGNLLAPGGVEARILFNSLLILAYNLIPWFVFPRGLRALEEEKPAAGSDTEPNWDDLVRNYRITPREKEVIALVCQGKRNREIADELFVSLQTVKDHLYRIYQKLQVRNRVELVNRVSGTPP